MHSISENIKLRKLTLADIPFAMGLKTKANWNQLVSDWEFLIKADKGGNFVAEYNGRNAGTATTLIYQDKFSWIGMVLVDPAFRGLGIGTTLLNAAIDFARDKGTVRLDATPQGKKLYEKLGFQTERELLRLERGGSMPISGHSPAAVIKSIPDDLAEMDASVFGANRGKVLRYLNSNSPDYACSVIEDGKVTGYCLGRSGSNYEHIGPLIAENTDAARGLLITALESCRDKPVIVDTFADNSNWIDFLKSMGFKIQRPLIRMYLGNLNHPGKPEMQYAIAGPELG